MGPPSDAWMGTKPRSTLWYAPLAALIRLEVRSDMTRTIPDTTIDRCVACDGIRLIALTFPGVGRTRQFERGTRPSAKCVTCGTRYVGPEPLPAASGLISVSDRDANRSAPWGPALAEWALRIDTRKNRQTAQTQRQPVAIEVAGGLEEVPA
jgi:hypothetical protein